MRHSSFALFVLAVVAAFLPAAAGARPISFGESETATALQWTACDGGYQCATLSVPLDYANAASGATPRSARHCSAHSQAMAMYRSWPFVAYTPCGLAYGDSWPAGPATRPFTV